MKSRFARIHPDGLPIFKADIGDRYVLYSPGHVAVVSRDDGNTIEKLFSRPITDASDKGMERFVQNWLTIAADAKARYEAKANKAFKPECLTVYLTGPCNLGCVYCYAKPHQPGGTGRNLDEKALRVAARTVASACSNDGKRFHLVIQGDGEALNSHNVVQRILDIVEEENVAVTVRPFKYISTNGVAPASEIRWLAKNFDLIGLSCDGPPDVQNSQRPTKHGQPTSDHVENCAQIVREEGGELSIRTTITPQTVERQSEIVAYLTGTLQASVIRFEPVYRMDRDSSLCFKPDQAEWFAEHFLKAQKHAEDLGCELTLSGVRLEEVHGPHCYPMQNVLAISSDGKPMACFLHQNPGNSIDHARFTFNGKEAIPTLERYLGEIDRFRIEAIKIPLKCRDCVNIYHCSRGCPDDCVLDLGPQHTEEIEAVNTEGFSCRVQRILAESWIVNIAQQLTPEKLHGTPTPGSLHSDPVVTRIREVLADSSRIVDVEGIIQQYLAVKDYAKIESVILPMPVWAQRGFDEGGEEAWRHIQRILAHDPAPKPISIYVHIPFCDRRCGFCNSHSHRLGRNGEMVAIEFNRRLLSEIEAWAGVSGMSRRSVTTVHFGGGTPNYLPHKQFSQVIRELRGGFQINDDTEWGLESTSTLLIDQHLDDLLELGFRRLHVGVQTLNDGIREMIGRREKGQEVVEKIRRALAKGFVVSVDIMYGLPTQKPTDLFTTIDRLTDVGIDGISLYGLHITNMNYRFLKRLHAGRRDMVRDYIMALAGEEVLKIKGLRKTHFTHFANQRDNNLYYTYPERGEDLLALGPTANGELARYHYRHPEYTEFMKSRVTKRPILEGGVALNPLEVKLAPAFTSLMSAQIDPEIFDELGADNLATAWAQSKLIARDPSGRRWGLTANGSWFINSMMSQLAHQTKITDNQVKRPI